VCERVDLGDSEGIGDDGGGSRSASGTFDAEAVGLGDDVCDHQEVGDEPHRVDDMQFAGESLHHGPSNTAVATQQPAMALFVQQSERSLARGHRKGREDGGFVGEVDSYRILADPCGVSQRIRQVAVQLAPATR